MSTLKVNTLQDTSGNTLSRVLQIVQTVKTDTSSVSVASGAQGTTDSFFSVSITPSSTSSLILLGGFITVNCSGGSQEIHITYRKGGSVLTTAVNGGSTSTSIGDGSGNRQQTSAGGRSESTYHPFSFPIYLLDKPASTSSLTYSFAMGHGSGTTRTMYLNRNDSDSNSGEVSRYISLFTATEIAP
tara:strand:+ start:168 stop:725 length:558 start_codon:yes stop_codon:yes gene_type:complete